jgi:hypothetical protein
VIEYLHSSEWINWTEVRSDYQKLGDDLKSCQVPVIETNVDVLTNSRVNGVESVGAIGASEPGIFICRGKRN